MTFYRGQKVVFVGAPGRGLFAAIRNMYRRFRHPYVDLTIGAVYTVANLYAADDGEEMIEIVEFDSGDPEYWAPGWRASGFRPAVSRKTDVSFTIGADPGSEQFDNRHKQKQRERA